LLAGLEIEPNNFDLNFNLANVYQRMSQDEKAYNIYREIINWIDEEQTKKEIKSLINQLNVSENNKDKKESEVDKESIVTEEVQKPSNNNKLKETEINKDIIKLFKKKEHQKVLSNIQELSKERDYYSLIKTCQYWLNNVNNKTAIIHYFLGVGYNGIKDFDKAHYHHKKALKLDNSLADLKNRETRYKNSYDEKETNCLGCGCDDYDIIQIENQSRGKDGKGVINPLRTWVKCKECGLIYSNPIPSEESLNKYYSLLAEDNKENVDKRFEFSVKMSNQRLTKIEEYNELDDRLLDIGTGAGFFVGTAIDRGWKAEGLELAEGNCEYAKEQLGIELINKDFYDFKYKEKYDVVTLFEVIEHLNDPKKALNRINEMVKDGGLVVVATPIRDSLYGKKSKGKNVFWTTVEHLIYFDKNVMLDYLKEAGFEVLEVNQSPEGMGRMEFYCRKISKKSENNSISSFKKYNSKKLSEINLNPGNNQFFNEIKDKAEPIFVLSTGRCGTKFLAKNLKKSKELISLHEPNPELIYYARYAYENKDNNYEILKAMIDSARFDLISKSLVQNKKYFESNNRLTFFAEQLVELYPKVKFIHLIRNPAEFVRSGIRRNWYQSNNLWEMGRIQPINNDINWEQMSQLAKISWLWNETNQFIEEFKAKINNKKIITVFSEDLFNDIVTLKNILNFIGVSNPFTDNELEAIIDKPVNKQKSGDFPEYNNWNKKDKKLLKKYAPLYKEYGYKL
ncbi:MAG: methyltransferase domain-containing protein, partial [Candidatus Woesearchaeota archaeon]